MREAVWEPGAFDLTPKTIKQQQSAHLEAHLRMSSALLVNSVKVLVKAAVTS